MVACCEQGMFYWTRFSFFFPLGKTSTSNCRRPPYRRCRFPSDRRWIPCSCRWLLFKCRSIVRLNTELATGWSEFVCFPTEKVLAVGKACDWLIFAAMKW